MKRIALFLGLAVALVSAASADTMFGRKPARIFVSVQLTEGETTLPISSLTLAEGSTGTAYTENTLPYIEKAEYAKRENGQAVEDSEEGVTMLVTPVLVEGSQIELELVIRKVTKPDANADATQMVESEVKHKLRVKSGVQTTVQIPAATEEKAAAASAVAASSAVQEAPAVNAGAVYTVTVIAQKM